MSYNKELKDYLEDLCAVLGHKKRHAPFRGYCKGLMFETLEAYYSWVKYRLTHLAGDDGKSGGIGDNSPAQRLSAASLCLSIAHAQ